MCDTPNNKKVRKTIIQYTSSGSLLFWALFELIKTGSIVNNLHYFFFVLICFLMQKQSGIFYKIKHSFGVSLDHTFDKLINSVLYSPANKAHAIKYFSEGKIDPRMSCAKIKREKRDPNCIKEFCHFGPNAFMSLTPEEVNTLESKINYINIRGNKPLQIDLLFCIDKKTTQLQSYARYDMIHATLSKWGFDRCFLALDYREAINFTGGITGFLMIPRFTWAFNILPFYKIIHVSILRNDISLELVFDENYSDISNFIKKCALTKNKISTNPYLKENLFFCR